MFGFEGLTPDMLLVFIIILITIVLFISEVVRIDVVAFLVLVMLGFSQIVPSDMLFLGFSSDAVIALIAVMIIGSGLEKSGVVAQVADWLLNFGGNSETKIRILLMSIGGVLAGFLRSVGSVALFLPVVTRVRRLTGISKSRLLMPLGFCAILGSTITMVGAGPLIILNSLLERLDGLQDASGIPTEPLSLFSVLPVGLSLLLIGILYFSVFGKWVLPKVKRKPILTGSSMDYFQRTYEIGGEYWEVRVTGQCPLIHKSLDAWEALLPPSVAVIALKQSKGVYFPPSRTQCIEKKAHMAIMGPKEDIKAFCEHYHLAYTKGLGSFVEKLNPAQAGLCETVIPPSSQLVGMDFNQIHMRKNFQVQVLSVLRGDKVRRGKELEGFSLRAGDTLGIYCEWRALLEIEKNPDFVIVTTDFPRDYLLKRKTKRALFFFVFALGLVLWGQWSLPVCLLFGAVGMIFSGVLSVDEAYDAVSWKTVFLLAGLIPLGLAVQITGAAKWVAEAIFTHFQTVSPIVLEIGLAIGATLLSLIMSNVGATVLLVPLAVQLALGIGGDPRLFALIVAIAASNSFLIPTHQANALISGPGRYHVKDFLKVGIGMTLLYLFGLLISVQFLF